VSPYDALAELAQRELQLVSTGEVDKLPELELERSALVASLPGTPPPQAQPSLERAAALQARVTAALDERLGAAGSELRHLNRGRTAMAGYPPQADRVKLVDRAG